MNYTNSSEVLPGIHDKQSSWSGRDIAYVVFASIQTIITIIALICGTCIVKKIEWRNEKRQLDREERDKIAEIVSQEYYTIENKNIPDRIRKAKVRFESMLMFAGTREVKITGLDVLRYMCEDDNYRHCQTTNLTKLYEDINAIVRLFQSFRIKLPLEGLCPENIKDELGPLITELGEITIPFVTGRKQNTISKVVAYFERNLEAPQRNDVEAVIEPATPVKAAMPYVRDYIRFGEEGQPYVSYENTEFHLKFRFQLDDQKQRQVLCELYDICHALDKYSNVGQLKTFVDCINDILQRKALNLTVADSSLEESIRVNVVHGVRVLYYLVSDGSDIVHDEQFDELVKCMDCITAGIQEGEVCKMRCDRSILDIRAHITNLESQKSAFILKDPTTVERLEELCDDIRKLISENLRRPADVQSISH